MSSGNCETGGGDRGADAGRFGGVRWNRWRRLSQSAFLMFFVALPFSYPAQHRVLGNLASLQLGALDLVDPATGLSSMLAARSASWTILVGMALPVLLALALGPMFCSWVCPWGLVSEMVDRLLRRKPRKMPRWLRPLRWSVLVAVLAASMAIGMPAVALVSAPRLLSQLPAEWIFLGSVSVGTLAVLGALLLLELVLPRRLWCRALCPVGSLLVLLRTPRTVTVAWSRPDCKTDGCGVRCVSSCSWNLDPRRLRPLDGCTNCGACVEDCPPELRKALTFGRLVRIGDGDDPGGEEANAAR